MLGKVSSGFLLRLEKGRGYEPQMSERKRKARGLGEMKKVTGRRMKRAGEGVAQGLSGH